MQTLFFRFRNLVANGFFMFRNPVANDIFRCRILVANSFFRCRNLLANGDLRKKRIQVASFASLPLVTGASVLYCHTPYVSIV